MFYQLPPVGNRIQLSRAAPPDAPLQTLADGYQAHYYASGTAALAAAIIAAIRLKPVDQPEVILPAYACPDLISAAVFAGARPVLVDLESDRPWLDLEQLPAKITANTVAIIAVHLFGIAERLARLRALAAKAGAVLIEDSAQAFSSGDETDIWQSDLLVLSFGRGKPVSLLGGGAVLCNLKNPHGRELATLLPEGKAQSESRLRKKTAFYLKAKLYNWMIRPGLYWLPQSLPFLHLGATRYQPLHSLNAMAQIPLALLPENIRAYRAEPMRAQQQLAAMLAECQHEHTGIVDLPAACDMAQSRRLLRYPLLVAPERRDLLYSQLQQLGLGPSRMYPAALPEIPGLETLLAAQGAFPAAAAFAERILTLPTHAQVRPADIEKIRRLLSR